MPLWERENAHVRSVVDVSCYDVLLSISIWWRKVLMWRSPTDTDTRAWWSPAIKVILTLYDTCWTRAPMYDERAWKVASTGQTLILRC